MGNLTNNKIRTYYIYGSFYEHDGLSNLAMCIYAYLKQHNCAKCLCYVLINLILKEKMRTEVKMVLQYLFSTSLLSRFTVSQLLAIYRCYCLKNT